MNESCRNQEHVRLTDSECLCNPPDVHLPQGPVLLTAHLHHQPGHGHVYWHTWHVARGTCRRPGWRRSCRAPRWRCRGRAARCSCPRTTWCPGRGTLSTCPPSDPSYPSIESCPGWLVFDNLKIVYVKGSASDNMGKPGSSHFRDPPLISEESPLKSEAVLIKYLDFWDR